MIEIKYDSNVCPYYTGNICPQEHDQKIITAFAEWLPKHFDLRFSSNPEVWVDEYFNHTSEKIIEQYKTR